MHAPPDADLVKKKTVHQPALGDRCSWHLLLNDGDLAHPAPIHPSTPIHDAVEKELCQTIELLSKFHRRYILLQLKTIRSSPLLRDTTNKLCEVFHFPSVLLILQEDALIPALVTPGHCMKEVMQDALQCLFSFIFA